ncbi:hypothetical protein MSG28_004078 [Choristoneura fumiferana]|uniref:Uncharacterized protein n=1 Tax=Choristoneura fumiferana TaxID=7141 RepID=A0ACC0KHC2_CHOFU|nr:hypothetical protein MSG28_004078 [Choristoneura fumiferana]
MRYTRFNASRSKKILGLVTKDSAAERETDTEKPKADSPLPATCTFGDAEWAALEGIVDEELSSDRNLATPNFSLLEATVEKSPIAINSDKESFILSSSENTPVPSPLEDFDISIQSQTEHNSNIRSTVSPLTPMPTEPEKLSTPTTGSPGPIASVSSLITVSECDSPSSTTSLNQKRRSTFKANPGKKRKRCEDKWRDTKRKLLLNSGQEYMTRKGKVKEEKKLKPVCRSTCKLKCYDKFDTDTRQRILTNFWKLGDHTQQWEYINKFTERQQKKSVTTEGSSRRQHTTKYFLPLSLPSNVSDQQCLPYDPVQVCLRTFLNTLCITDQMVRTAQAKLSREGITLPDERGKHPNHLVVITAEMVKSVCEHVSSFQPVPSHYTRESSSKLYLDNKLSFKKMFSLYKEWDQLQNYDSKALTLRQYTDIVNEHMNVGFYVPKKDICDKCHAFSNEANPTEDQISAQSQHIENKKNAREFKADDKIVAQNSPEIVCATFDFQKILNCPHGDVGLLYYKRKLSIYNFTIFDLANKEGFCYMWTECTAKRGANEVSSCLSIFIKTLIDKGAKRFLFWSDNCSGQNRNRVVYSTYMFLSKKYNVDITHRFLERGHTQNEGDSVHALIEKESKGKMIFTPDQWYALVRWAKTTGKPYNVIELTQQDVFDYKPLLDERNWKRDTTNINVMWNKVKEVRVEKDAPNCLFFKYDLKGEQFCLNTVITTRRRGKIMNDDVELKMAYGNPLTITDAKYKDLISLCQSGVIPKEYHTFFKNINYSANIGDNSDDSD